MAEGKGSPLVPITAAAAVTAGAAVVIAPQLGVVVLSLEAFDTLLGYAGYSMLVGGGGLLALLGLRKTTKE